MQTFRLLVVALLGALAHVGPATAQTGPGESSSGDLNRSHHVPVSEPNDGKARTCAGRRSPSVPAAFGPPVAMRVLQDIFCRRSPGEIAQTDLYDQVMANDGQIRVSGQNYRVDPSSWESPVGFRILGEEEKPQDRQLWVTFQKNGPPTVMSYGQTSWAATRRSNQQLADNHPGLSPEVRKRVLNAGYNNEYARQLAGDLSVDYFAP